MGNLKKQQFIKEENLNNNYYFQSILQEAFNHKILNEYELENIQLQSLDLLSKQIKRYTSGDSTSIRTETAQNILQSISYTISIYLKNLNNLDICIDNIKQESLENLYKKGKLIIIKQIDKSKKLYYLIQKNSIATNNIAYNDTIEKGISFFFENYDLDFFAHDTPASIDYPLSNDKIDLVGIEYIYSFLQNLFWENKFCINFKESYIHKILLGFNNNYPDLLINIFDLVFTNALGCILLEKDVFELNIEPWERKFLKQKLSSFSKKTLIIKLDDALNQIYNNCNITNKFMQEYISTSFKKISNVLKNNLNNTQLESIFVTFKEDDIYEPYLFNDGPILDDELFRSIANEIRECRYVSDKIAIIQNEIHSIIDLIDILEGSCICEHEYFDIFYSFEDTYLSLLIKDIPINTKDIDCFENEKQWQSKLKEYFNLLDSKRKNSIIELSKIISLK
ncbi:MAG: DUF6179 domain-containing protein [Eubacteriaceae bacterium]